MKYKALIVIAIVTIFLVFQSNAMDKGFLPAENFNIEKDLLLVQFDCKTDVDDLHSVAAMATLLSDPEFSNIHYHAVAGTYGIQEGLYVPPNPLFQLAFGENWTDAHENYDNAVKQVTVIIKATLANQGDVWIADAGQSDFTAGLIKAVQSDLPEVITSQRIHVVQHADWNEEVTAPANLKFVKENTDYHKIPDGNAVGNGTPGFRSSDYTLLKNKIANSKLTDIWQLAIEISNEYNGKEGRFNNSAIAAGGLDFSDLAEVCWILGLQDIRDTEQFFHQYAY